MPQTTPDGARLFPFRFSASLFLVLAIGVVIVGIPASAPGQQPLVKPDAPQSAPAPTAGLYGRTVDTVRYEGLRLVDESKLKRVVVLRSGGLYTRQDEQQALRKIFALGFFDPDVRVRAEVAAADPAKVDIIFTVKENAQIEEVTITGNTQISTEALERELPFKKGDVLPTDARVGVEKALGAAYRKQGYTKATAALEVKELPTGTVALAVRIDEGGRILVRDIGYEGNESFTSLRLGFHTASKSSFLFVKNYYDAVMFEQDLAAVRDFYYSMGFLDVKVTEGTSTWNDSRTEVSLVIKIDEGKRYELGEVDFSGHTLFTTAELRAQFSRAIGQTLDRERMNKALEGIRSLYGDSGWILVNFEQELVPDPSTGQALLKLDINEGQRIRVAAISRTERVQDIPESELGAFSRFFARLAPPVKDEVVLRHVRLHRGEVYRREQQLRSERELRGLRVFKSVRIENTATDDPYARDVNVITEVDNTGFLLLRAGIGGGDGGFVGAELTERNLFGEARAAGISATIGTDSFGLGLSYRDRDFRGSGNELLSRAFYQEYNRRGYDETQIGLTNTLTMPIDDVLKEAWRVRLADVSLDPDDDVEADLNDYFVAAVRYSRSIDLRDDYRNPTEGYLLEGGIEGGVADAFFVKLTGDYNWYKRLVGDLGYSLDGSASLIPTPGDRDDLGLSERLFLGGTSDLRGYRFRGAGERDRGDNDVALGGLSKLLLRNELSHPLGVPNLKGIVFLDAGSLDEDFAAWNSPRFSTGFGFRYSTNAISAGLDFGFALNKKSGDKTQLVHFILESGI